MISPKIRSPIGTPIPSALYSCANNGCAEERTWPADDLRWVPQWQGWYCDICIDNRESDEDVTVDVGISLAEWISERNTLGQLS